MSFVGAGFLAGLLGIALPLAIHLFAKRKRVPMAWGAMRFLSEAKPTWRRRTLRLQDWLVLLLRIAAVALLALAFARPLWQRPVPPGDGQQWLIVVDRSPSTELGSDGDRIADQIQQQLADTLAELPETTRLDIFVNGSDHGTGLLRLPPSDGQPFNTARNQKSWLASLQSLRSGAGTIDWSEAIRAALSFPPIPVASDENSDNTSDSNRFAKRNVLLITDAAAEAWPYPTSDASDAALAHWKRSVETSQHNISVAALPVGRDHSARNSPNLCIDHITIDPPRATPGETVTLRATVTNRGTEAAVPATAHWSDSTDSASVSAAEIPDLAPGAAHELVLQREFTATGPATVQLEITSNDALKSDDQATAIVEIIDRLKIITVTDEAANRIADNDVRFSHWAFATAAAASGSVFELVPLTINDFANTDLDDIAAVVWSANDRDPAAVGHSAEKLYRFVSHGGGLWLRPPPTINATAFNDVFFPHDYGLSPAALAVPALISTANGRSIGLRPPETADRSSDLSSSSTTDGLTRNALGSLGELQAKRHLALRQPLPPTTTVLAELEGGKAFILRRQLGRGQVLLTTLDSHPKSANLAACSGYLPMVREILWQLAGGSLLNRNLAPGDLGPWSQLDSQDAVRLPDGEWISPLPADASDRRNTPFVTPGLYLADVHNEGQQETEGADSPFAVGRIAEESNLAAAPVTYFESLATIDKLSIIEPGKFSDYLAEITQPAAEPVDPLTLSEDESPAPSNATHEKEIGAWLLVALLGFLLLELLSAQHLLSRRRRASGRG